ncbi:MAG: hypothetical protein KKF50_04470 [Nanoarchaeota archaeon]|nr:hypothetical protein [Nanoarchaeota archaeon]
MDKKLIEEIKKKREFSGLPDSIVERAAEMAKGAPNGHDSGEPDVKKSRALLRKYFGVFLTNKVLKGKGSAEEMLKSHMSSKKRDYEEFYGEIFKGMGNVGSVIDLGAGANGFSYDYLKKELGAVNYLAVEASGQLVDNMNDYFQENKFSAKAVVGDLFDLERIKGLLESQKKPRVVFMFQVVDALENLEKDFFKKFFLRVSKECEKIVLSLPTESLGGRKKFAVQRKWIIDFLSSKDDPGGPCENFMIEKDFKTNGERVLVIGKKPNN